MLVEFSVSNFRSILKTQTLSMVADGKKDRSSRNTFVSDSIEKMNLLKSAVIYGPNAGGKSNFIRAISFMSKFVITRNEDTRKDNIKHAQRFVFSKVEQPTPIAFEMVFIANGVRYQYGFSLSENCIISEWLFAFPKKKLQRWFERDYDIETQKTTWYFGPSLGGHKSTWRDSTRQDALFLTTAVDLNSLQLKPIYDWFKKLSVIRYGTVFEKHHTILNCANNKEKTNTLLSLLKAADPTIQGIEFKKKPFSLSELPSDIPPEMAKKILLDMKGKESVQVELLHAPDVHSSDSDEYVSSYISLNEESDGTKKLFSYISLWMDALANGAILIIDELESSFHIQLLTLLIELFHNNKINVGNGQLIFATHETSLLQKKIFRRDQIWFIEKQGNLQSVLYPLSSFQPRKEDALQSRYLQGRYGAIPFTENIEIRFDGQ